MKLRGLAVAPALLLLAACSGESESATVQTVTVETTPADTAIDWDYIRTEYSETLANTECIAGSGTIAGVCNQLRNSDLDTLRIDVEQLPASRDKTKMLEALSDWDEQYDEYDEKMCLGSLNTGQIDCSFDETLLNLSAITIEAIAKNAVT